MRPLALACLVLAVGCSSDQSPLGNDYYALANIAGDPLPARYAANSSSGGLLVADSIAFHENGTGIRRWVYQDAGSTERHTLDTEFNWTRDGNDIAITFVCPPLASCIAGPHLTGTINDDAMTITASAIMRAPLLYVRSGVILDRRVPTRPGAPR
jgi:hypothetical protein